MSITTGSRPEPLHLPRLNGGRIQAITSVRMIPGWRTSRFQKPESMDRASGGRQSFEFDYWVPTTMVSSICATHRFFATQLRLRPQSMGWVTGVTTSLRYRRTATSSTKSSGLAFPPPRAQGGSSRHPTFSFSGSLTVAHSLCETGGARTARRGFQALSAGMGFSPRDGDLRSPGPVLFPRPDGSHHAVVYQGCRGVAGVPASHVGVLRSDLAISPSPSFWTQRSRCLPEDGLLSPFWRPCVRRVVHLAIHRKTSLHRQNPMVGVHCSDLASCVSWHRQDIRETTVLGWSGPPSRCRTVQAGWKLCAVHRRISFAVSPGRSRWNLFRAAGNRSCHPPRSHRGIPRAA